MQHSYSISKADYPYGGESDKFDTSAECMSELAAFLGTHVSVPRVTLLIHSLSGVKRVTLSRPADGWGDLVTGKVPRPMTDRGAGLFAPGSKSAMFAYAG